MQRNEEPMSIYPGETEEGHCLDRGIDVIIPGQSWSDAKGSLSVPLYHVYDAEMMPLFRTNRFDET